MSRESPADGFVSSPRNAGARGYRTPLCRNSRARGIGQNVQCRRGAHGPSRMGMLQRSFPSARSLRALALIPVLALISACERAVLNPAGDVARQQRDIIYISTGLMLLIIVPVIILIVVFAWRYRKGKGGTYDPDFDHSTALELVIWSAPLMIIIILGALTWSSTHLLDPFRPLDAKATDQEAGA